MKKYFYIDSETKQQGPCSLDELQNAGVSPKTKIWFAGLNEWTNADEIPELAAILGHHTPPPTYDNANQAFNHTSGNHTHQPNVPAPAKPDSWLAWAILSTVLCCLPFGIPAIVYASRVDNYWSQGRYTEARDAAENAHRWVWISVIAGVVSQILYIISMLVFSFTPFWAMSMMDM